MAAAVVFGGENEVAAIVRSKRFPWASPSALLIHHARKPEATKRQRTASASPSPSRNPVQPASRPDAEEGANGRTGVKKIRGAAARNHKEKELREEKERAKHEAATKRKGRAERRRVDGEEAYQTNKPADVNSLQIQIRQKISHLR